LKNLKSLRKIAVSGKGGVGKTTFAGMLSCLLAEDGYDVVAIDADPDMNLASVLGSETPPPLTSYKSLIEERVSMGGGLFRYNPKVDDILERFGVLTPCGVRLLVMGTLEKGGTGCMCPATSFLRALLRYLLKMNMFIVMDMEAGIEHLGRGTARGFDVMIVVVENGLKAVQTAERIKKLSKDIGIENVVAVLNKVSGDCNRVMGMLAELGIPIVGEIPFDEGIVRAELEGIPPYLTAEKALRSVEEIKERLLSESIESKSLE